MNTSATPACASAKLRIERERRLEQLERVLDARAGLIPRVTPAQVQVVRLEVRRVPRRERRARCLEQRDLERLDDRRRDLVLDVEHVRRFAIVALRPELKAAS